MDCSRSYKIFKMPYTDEKGNIVLTNRDCVVAYMPKMPAIEAENEKLKLQNTELKADNVDLNVKLKKAEKQVSTYQAKGAE
ncbi:hypothetical protein L6452_40446 [Arctium lappa]|uniref:Uncharacterized protein n=1 Tax=Arctium lappa TaxID=4217 RepID=A0ACB8XN49_ARCLA|nr:hypothetical protein L6452_40446 [Arctium lappa]